MDWPTAAVLIALIVAVMVIASTYIASRGPKPYYVFLLSGVSVALLPQEREWGARDDEVNRRCREISQQEAAVADELRA